jgi:hypothetical protein
MKSFLPKKIIFASFFRVIWKKNDICGQKKENDFVFQLFFYYFFPCNTGLRVEVKMRVRFRMRVRVRVRMRV